MEPDFEYTYAVLAFNEIGDGLLFDTDNARPWRSQLIPGAPRSLVASVKGTRATLRWLAPEDDGGTPITGYVVFRGGSRSDIQELVHIGVALTYVDDDLEEGTTYYYGVAALNVVGRGEMTPTVEATVGKPKEAFSSSLLYVLIICMCILVAGTTSIVSTETGRYRWGLLLGPLTTRLKRDEVLDNKTRHALHGIIIENPGIHYKAIMREFDLKNGVAAYHLSVLEEKRYIKSVRDGRLKRFYSIEAKVPRDQRLTPEEIRETIIDLVETTPGISQRDIVNELGINDDTVGYHLRTMVGDGQLRASKKGRYTIYHRRT